MSVKKLIICGFPGTGKSTFLRFLDGHPQILGTQLNEKFLDMFTLGRQDWEEIARKRKSNPRAKATTITFPLKWNDQIIDVNLVAVRRILSKYSYYHLIEAEAQKRETYDSFSSEGWSLLSFHFDFEKFERTWKGRLFDGQVKTPESVVDIFYQSFFVAWEDYPVRYSEDTYLAFCGPTYKESFDLIFEQNFNAKFVYIERETEGVIATRLLREQLATSQSATNKLQILQKAKEIHQERAEIQRLAQKHPGHFFMTTMEKFVTDPASVMKDLMAFLRLPVDEKISIPTHLGVPLTGQYSGKINDDWRKVLTPSDLGVIHYMEGKVQWWQLLAYGMGSWQAVLKIEIKRLIRSWGAFLKSKYKKVSVA